MYHPIKSGCKKISSSVATLEIVIFDCMSTHCDPELEDKKPIFVHDSLPMMMHHHTNFPWKKS